MKIRLLKDQVVNGAVYAPGTEHEVDERPGLRLVEQGVAEVVVVREKKEKAVRKGGETRGEEVSSKQ